MFSSLAIHLSRAGSKCRKRGNGGLVLLLLPNLPAVLLLLALNLVYGRGDSSTAVVSSCFKRKATHAARKDGARTVEAHLGGKPKSGVAIVSPALECVGRAAAEGSHERRSDNRRIIRCRQRSGSASLSLARRTASKRAQAPFSHVLALCPPPLYCIWRPSSAWWSLLYWLVLRDERLWFGEPKPKHLLWCINAGRRQSWHRIFVRRL